MGTGAAPQVCSGPWSCLHPLLLLVCIHTITAPFPLLLLPTASQVFQSVD